LILAGDVDAEWTLDQALRREGRATLLGERLREDKIRGLAPGQVDALLERADLVLVEADGARSRSLKLPADHEPVIPSRSSLVLVLVGLDVLGCPLDEERVHRVEMVSAAAGRSAGSTVDEDVVVAALLHPSGYSGRLPKGTPAAVFLNKAEGDLAEAAAARIAPRLVPPYARAIAGSARGGPVRVWG
jgi:probable selenium-dependent hydroxylase accessory protein YqeC